MRPMLREDGAYLISFDLMHGKRYLADFAHS
jgi:hypothetical protein